MSNPNPDLRAQLVDRFINSERRKERNRKADIAAALKEDHAQHAPPIHQMSREDLKNEECSICMNSLYLPGENGEPCEIKKCKHRFHLRCLGTNCRTGTNSRLNCACPICRQIFKYTTFGIEYLGQRVADRFAVLDAERAPLLGGKRKKSLKHFLKKRRSRRNRKSRRYRK